jgi:predicted kinase
VIVMMAGLPGTGKSTVAEAAAARLPGAHVLSKDRLRAELFDPERAPYSAEQNDYLLELMLAEASRLLDDGARFVFLDGRTFSRVDQRERVKREGRAVRLVECVCAESLALRRIAADKGHPAVDRDAALYARVKAQWEAVSEPRLVIDTGLPLGDCVGRVVRWLTA